MKAKSIQDHYPDEYSYCYGCGRLNEKGHQIKSYPDGEEAVAHFTPQPYYIAVPGFVYGGLIASLIDCHGIGTAAIAYNRAKGNEASSDSVPRYVTASLQIDYLKPTPLGVELELRGKVLELKGRKAISQVEVFANGSLTARGTVVAVQIPDSMTNTGK